MCNTILSILITPTKPTLKEPPSKPVSHFNQLNKTVTHLPAISHLTTELCINFTSNPVKAPVESLANTLRNRFCYTTCQTQTPQKPVRKKRILKPWAHHYSNSTEYFFKHIFTSVSFSFFITHRRKETTYPNESMEGNP